MDFPIYSEDQHYYIDLNAFPCQWLIQLMEAENSMQPSIYAWGVSVKSSIDSQAIAVIIIATNVAWQSNAYLITSTCVHYSIMKDVLWVLL